jgi:3-hydroxyacyl-[acyl-carrier-protein] dehydratase
MLAGKLYTLERTLEETEDSGTYRIGLNAEHPVFEGHFPGRPVVPGVTMMQTIQELLEDKLNRKVVLKKAGNMKFLNMIDPAANPQIDVTIQHKEQDGEIKVTASLKFEALTFMKFQGSFVAAS